MDKILLKLCSIFKIFYLTISVSL